jgi:glycine/D-amino acid oxidase-like deaminating enzyme
LSYYLLDGGHEVILTDAAKGAIRTSVYNAGQLSSRPSFTEIFAPSDAVRISAAERRRNREWFCLARSQSRERYESVSMSLSARSLALYDEFFWRERARVNLTGKVLELYSVLRVEEPGGTGARFLSAEELSEVGYKGFEGGWLKEEKSLHSGKLLNHLRSRISDMGTVYLKGEAHLKNSGSRISYAVVNGEEFVADAYVVAGGSWSREICKPLHYDPMLIPARGLALFYRTLGQQVIDYPGHYADEQVTVTQHDRDNVRLTSFFELVGFNPNFSQPRTNWLFRAVTSHFSRAFTLELSEAGVGYRPCTPDQLPLVGRIPHCENGYIVSGACRKGMVLAPVLSQLLMSLVLGSGETDQALLGALDPGRFGGEVRPR